MGFKDIRETFKTVREELNRPILDKRIVEQAQELGKQANETLKKLEDREIVELVIREHEKENYIKDGYEIIHENVLTLQEGKSSVKVCYREKSHGHNLIVVVQGYVNGDKVETSYMYMGYELVKAILKAIEGEGKV